MSSTNTQPEVITFTLLAENIDGLLMPITSSTGDLVYCNMTDNAPKIIKKSRQKPRGSANGLLGIPIALLMDDVEHDSIVKALAESTSRPLAPVLVRTFSPGSLLVLLGFRMPCRSCIEMDLNNGISDACASQTSQL